MGIVGHFLSIKSRDHKDKNLHVIFHNWLIWLLFNWRGMTLMELSYSGYFIDQLLRFEEPGLSGSNATKQEGRGGSSFHSYRTTLCSHLWPYHTRLDFQVCIIICKLHSQVEHGCSFVIRVLLFG
jgi:hypothetical protein